MATLKARRKPVGQQAIPAYGEKSSRAIRSKALIVLTTVTVLGPSLIALAD